MQLPAQHTSVLTVVFGQTAALSLSYCEDLLWEDKTDVGALGRLELNCGAEWATERCAGSAVVGESE